MERDRDRKKRERIPQRQYLRVCGHELSNLAFAPADIPI